MTTILVFYAESSLIILPLLFCISFLFLPSVRTSRVFHIFLCLSQPKGINKIPLASFVGNSFNILFYDAAGVFFLKQHMFDYLSQSHDTSLNHLIQAVLADLHSSHLVTGCRALGIVDKLISGLLWRYLQLSNVSILDMSQVYTTIMSNFEE